MSINPLCMCVTSECSGECSRTMDDSAEFHPSAVVDTVDDPEEWTAITGAVHRMGCACPQCLSAGRVHVMCDRCEKCTRSACEIHLLCYCGERFGRGPRI